MRRVWRRRKIHEGDAVQTYPFARVAMKTLPSSANKNQHTHTQTHVLALLPTPSHPRQAASPELRQHVSLPRTARRLGRRPYHSPRGPKSGSPTDISAAPLAGVGGGGHGGGGSASGDWDVTSPPEVPGRRPGFGVGVAGDSGGLEPGFTGEAEGGRGVVGEGIRGCAEWAVSFTGCLEKGITTVKVGEGRASGAAAPRRGRGGVVGGLYGLAKVNPSWLRCNPRLVVVWTACWW